MTTTTRKRVAIQPTKPKPDLFTQGWNDASLKRMPEFTDIDYQMGYFGWMKQNLETTESGMVRWSKVKPMAGWSDRPDLACNCPF